MVKNEYQSSTCLNPVTYMAMKNDECFTRNTSSDSLLTSFPYASYYLSSGNCTGKPFYTKKFPMECTAKTGNVTLKANTDDDIYILETYEKVILVEAPAGAAALKTNDLSTEGPEGLSPGMIALTVIGTFFGLLVLLGIVDYYVFQGVFIWQHWSKHERETSLEDKRALLLPSQNEVDVEGN